MFKPLVQRLVLRCGYDLFRHDGRHHESNSRKALLGRMSTPTVLDVGANHGQFVEELREDGFRGRNICFEPLSAPHAIIAAASARDANWIVADRVAIGSEAGQAEINISGNSVSSSMLPIEKCHLKVAPTAAYVGKESVPVMRLDDAVAPRGLRSTFSRARPKSSAHAGRWSWN